MLYFEPYNSYDLQTFISYEFHYTDQCSGKRFDKLVF